MVETGVYATEAEAAELRELAERASRTPVILATERQRGTLVSAAEEAWETTRKRCHALALVHGLPEIEGYYGADRDGQFVRMD